MLAFFALARAFSQQPFSLPAWLQSYPGATVTVHSSDSIIESSYTAAAQPADIVDHYRKLFEAAGLAFQPNSDGLGMSIRSAAPECDLLIQIRSRTEGAFVKVNCSAKSQSSLASASPGDVKVISSGTQSTRAPSTTPAPQAHLTASEMMEQHKRIAAEMGLGVHRQYHDAAAPPLVWPSWLVNVTGAAVRAETGIDQAKKPMLRARYTTNVPMTEIYSFYRELLNAHEYPARSSMTTGHTMTGIQQNALGYVEGANYPDGAPGAYSTIYVSFDRQVLNGPITVSLRFMTHEFIASRGY